MSGSAGASHVASGGAAERRALDSRPPAPVVCRAIETGAYTGQELQAMVRCILAEAPGALTCPTDTAPAPPMVPIDAVPIPVDATDLKHKMNHDLVKQLLQGADEVHGPDTVVFRTPDGRLSMSALGERRTLSVINIDARKLIKVTKKGGPRPALQWGGRLSASVQRPCHADLRAGRRRQRGAHRLSRLRGLVSLGRRTAGQRAIRGGIKADVEDERRRKGEQEQRPVPRVLEAGAGRAGARDGLLDPAH